MFKNYLKIALRNLSRHKGYAAINIIGLVLGLAAFWLITLNVADELSYDRYNTNADRIVRVAQHASWDGGNLNIALTSAPFAPALKATYPEIESTVRIDPEGGGIITYQDKKIKADDIIFADNSLLKIFTYHFLYGNAATALTNPKSIVITEGLAGKIFGSTDNAINQTIYFDNTDACTVTGVIQDIPGNSHLRFSGVRPLPANYTENWQNSHLYTYLLLKNAANYKQLENKLPDFAAKTIQKEMGVKDYRMELQPLTSIHLHSNLGYEISANGSISRVYIFIAIALLILIIAIINYMNLSTARSSSRIREIGVRKAIGSGRGHLAGMFISEAVVVTMIAATMATVLVNFALPFFNQLSGKQVTIWRFGMANTLILLAGFSLLTGVISGIYPSLFLSRFKTIPALKGELGNVAGNIAFRKSLVVFQFVITVIMIVGSVTIYRQLQYALHTDIGFNKDQVLTFHINDRNVRSQVPALKTQLLQSPLITGVAAAGNPIGNNDLGSSGYRFEKNDGVVSDNSKMVQQLMTDADYLQTMEIKIIQGRNFSEAIPSDRINAAVVNETMVHELGWKEPIGKQLFKEGNKDEETIPLKVIGVVKDFHTYSLQHKVESLVMIMPPNAKEKDNLYVKIAKGKIPEGLAYIKKIYALFDKTDPVEYHFLDENFAKQYASEEKQGQMAFIFSLLAIMIACLGLFGLAAFSAQQRTKEIGIRKVLGASVTDIVQILSTDFLKLVLIATIMAIPISWIVMNKWLMDFAYRITMSWWVFVIAGITALLIALITVGLQAIKAALANPVKSLRAE
ncbi:MAG: ABC transporter permease [Ginsengibacter sp.]